MISKTCEIITFYEEERAKEKKEEESEKHLKNGLSFKRPMCGKYEQFDSVTKDETLQN